MPLVIKPAAIHIKDDNGNYYPQNIVAEKTTEEYVTKVTQEGTKQVTAVNSAGSAQVSAVQNKGDTVLASIPSDYTSLQNDVDSLREDLINTVGYSNVDVFPKTIISQGTQIRTGQISNAYVDASVFNFTASGADISFGINASVGEKYASNYGALIPVSVGDIISVIVSGQGFAKNYVSIYNSDMICIYQSGNQWKNSFTLEIPENGAYISLRVGRQSAVVGTQYSTKISVYINKNETVLEKIESASTIINTKQSMGVSKIRSIAHQGYTPLSGYNWCKLDGYENAAKAGFSYGECDIAFSSDSVPMCSHDASFTDSKTGEVVVIAEHTATELETYTYHAGKISRFEDVVKTCKICGIGLYIDHISTSWTDDNWQSVFDSVVKYGMQTNVAWLASNSALVSKVLALDEYAELAPVISFSNVQDAIDLLSSIKTASNKITLNFDHSTITNEDVIALRKAIPSDVRIEICTVDDSSIYESFLPYADGITSNKICPSILVTE